jgi:GNAT superfamily N-acetyltransferase
MRRCFRKTFSLSQDIYAVAGRGEIRAVSSWQEVCLSSTPQLHSCMPDHHGVTISTDPARFDIDLIHNFLSSSYWARNIPREVVEKCIRNSLSFGAFADGRQVGFARAVTDRATFAYLADVFVVREYRGRGISKLLLRAILDHPDLQGLRRLLLATRDAHGLYAKFGFKPLAEPELYMTIHNPNTYQQSAAQKVSG